MKLDTVTLFTKSLAVIVNVLILYIIVILMIGLGITLFSLKALLTGNPFSLAFAQIITDILTFLVIIELFRGFIEYFKAQRFQLHTMLDPAIVFVIREMIIRLYKVENISWETQVGFASLILALGVVRSLAVHFSPDSEAKRAQTLIRG